MKGGGTRPHGDQRGRGRQGPCRVRGRCEKQGEKKKDGCHRGTRTSRHAVICDIVMSGTDAAGGENGGVPGEPGTRGENHLLGRQAPEGGHDVGQVVGDGLNTAELDAMLREPGKEPGREVERQVSDGMTGSWHCMEGALAAYLEEHARQRSGRLDGRHAARLARYA